MNMAKSRNQKGKILVIEHLLQGTGESRIVTMQEILDKLLEYGITAERKSIYDDIEALREFGLDVQYKEADQVDISGRGTGNCCGTGVSSHKRGSRDFKKCRDRKKIRTSDHLQREYT